MSIEKVWIEEGCLADGICNDLCPGVFGLDDNGEAYVRDDADFIEHEDCIRDAARECPVEIIHFDER